MSLSGSAGRLYGGGAPRRAANASVRDSRLTAKTVWLVRWGAMLLL